MGPIWWPNETFPKRLPKRRPRSTGFPWHPTDPWVETSAARQSAFAPQGPTKDGWKPWDHKLVFNWQGVMKISWQIHSNYRYMIYDICICIYIRCSWSLYALPTRRHSPLRLQRPLHSVKPSMLLLPFWIRSASCHDKVTWSMPSCSWSLLKSLSI